MATRRRAEFRSGPRSRFEFDSGSSSAAVGGQQEDVVDPQGTRWRCFSTGGQESRVNMSVLQPYLRVLSHGGERERERERERDRDREREREREREP